MTQRLEPSPSSSLDKSFLSSPTPSDHHLPVTAPHGQKVDSSLISTQNKPGHQQPLHQSSSHHQHSPNVNNVNHGHHSHISSVNVTGGPLSYTYALDSIHLHFGTIDTKGSEHTIEGIAFPGEVSLFVTINTVQVKRERRSRKEKVTTHTHIQIENRFRFPCAPSSQGNCVYVLAIFVTWLSVYLLIACPSTTRSLVLRTGQCSFIHSYFRMQP